MTLLVLVLISILVVAAAYRLLRGPNLPIGSLEDFEKHSYPVDLVAFENLLTSNHAQALEEHLPQNHKRIERLRKRLILAYVSCIAKNCVLVLRLGESARLNGTGAVHDASTELVREALHCRLTCLRAVVLCRLALWFDRPTGEVLADYRKVTSSLQHFTLASDPTWLSRISEKV